MSTKAYSSSTCGSSQTALIDVIIPTVEGREDSLDRCIASYECHTTDFNLIVVQHSPSAGEGWIAGTELSTAPYVHLSCDDLELVDPAWARVCMETVDRGELPCPLVYGPGGRIESCGGELAAGPIYGALNRELLPDGHRVGFTVVPFLSRRQLDEIGLLPIHYSSDVWVSERGRQLGYPTVVRHAYCFTHHRSRIKRGAGMGEKERLVADHRRMRAALAT